MKRARGGGGEEGVGKKRSPPIRDLNRRNFGIKVDRRLILVLDN